MRSSTPSKARGRRPDAGFTMLELLTALAVATAAIAGALTMHMRVVDAMRAMQEDNHARQAVVNELEILRALPFDELAALEGAQAFRSGADLLAPLHLAEGHVTVRQAALPGLLEIHAHVVWIGQHGRRIERGISTLVADRGGNGDD